MLKSKQIVIRDAGELDIQWRIYYLFGDLKHLDICYISEYYDDETKQRIYPEWFILPSAELHVTLYYTNVLDRIKIWYGLLPYKDILIS